MRNTKKVIIVFKVINKDTKKPKSCCFYVLLRCFCVFIVNFEQVDVCLDNCCKVKFFKTHLKSLAKMNTVGWCKNRYFVKDLNINSHRESE